MKDKGQSVCRRQSAPGMRGICGRKGTLAFFLLVSSLSICAWAQSPAQAQRAHSHYQQAQRHFQERDLEKAQREAALALELVPRMAEAANLLGVIAGISGRLVDAESYFKRVIDSRPDHGPAHFNLARIYLSQNKLEIARRELNMVVRLDPSHGEAHYFLGLIFLKADEPQDAIPHFEKAYRINPQNYEVLAGLIECQLALNRQGEAENTFQKIDRLLDARNPRLLQFGASLAGRGAYGMAIATFQKILRTDPDSYDANYNLALAFFLSNDTKSAEAALKRLLLRHDVAEVHNLLARVYQGSKKYVEAVTEYGRAASLDPSNEDFRLDYCVMLIQHRALDFGIKLLTQAAEDFPKSGRLWMVLGAAYYVAGNYAQAFEPLSRATEVAPDLSQSYYFLGRVYKRVTGQLPNRIMEKLKSYLALEPNDPWAHYFYGVGLFEEQQKLGAEDLAEAETYFKKAIRLKGDFAEAHFSLGLLYNVQGRIADSVVQFQRAVESDPEMPEVHYRLGVAYSKLGEKERAEEEFQLQQKMRKLRADTREKRRKDFVQIVPILKQTDPAAN